jgi:hypothetical protein
MNIFATPFHVKNVLERGGAALNHIVVTVFPTELTTVLASMEDAEAKNTTNYVVGPGKKEIIETIPIKFAGSIETKIYGGNLLKEGAISIGLAAPELTSEHISSLLYLMKAACDAYEIPLNKIFSEGSGADNLPWFDMLNTLGSMLVADFVSAPSANDDDDNEESF